MTNPADLQRNGKQEPITKAPTPRRHTVTVGGMDLEMGQRANQVNINLVLTEAQIWAGNYVYMFLATCYDNLSWSVEV